MATGSRALRLEILGDLYDKKVAGATRCFDSDSIKVPGCILGGCLQSNSAPRSKRNTPCITSEKTPLEPTHSRAAHSVYVTCRASAIVRRTLTNLVYHDSVFQRAPPYGHIPRAYC